MEISQKLLYISGLIVIGVAIIVGINKFNSSSAESNFDALHIDLLEIAGRARSYYKRSDMTKGGGYSFKGLTADRTGLSKIFAKPKNENGTFEIITAGNDDSLVVQATGHHDSDDDGQLFTIRMSVYPDSQRFEVVSY
ncbi:MAG: hypothetical protein GF353_00585 [Candidatus Lokiarchaeota archaeon]|nr:hypothetical protein [Candidatus Lokiarchaeota archaeon]